MLFRRYHQYSRKYGDQYRLVKFEELVSDPEMRLKDLCVEMDLELQERMLAQTVISAGFKSGKVGFDSQAAKRWENRIPGWVAWWFRTIFKKQLISLGYPV